MCSAMQKLLKTKLSRKERQRWIEKEREKEGNSLRIERD